MTEENRKIVDNDTGSHDFKDSKVMVYPFGRYDTLLRLTLNDKFIEVLEVKINKDFLSHTQKIASLRNQDVHEYYEEEE